MVILFVYGDVVSRYVIHPDDITDDPKATAENLIFHGKFELGKPDADYHMIMFKR